MAITNYERVGKALELLKAGLAPFVERELETRYGKYWITEVTENWRNDLVWPDGQEKPNLDTYALLRMMWDEWNSVFKFILGQAERSLVSELRDVRNAWAHQEQFSSDDAYRALDSTARLLTAVSAAEAEEVEKMKMELLRLRFDEQVRGEKRKTAGTPIESAAAASLKPWREVVTPHPDVASGRYQQAEFAADLFLVYQGEGSDEYLNPVEFFRRTYLTVSLKDLLVDAIRRLSGAGGDPVVQLQTNFGGGKTHSMLALYHLFSGITTTELAGIDAIVTEAGTGVPTGVHRVVLVGNRIPPGSAVVKHDGTQIRTIWGEMAWQLGGKEAFERIREDDENSTSPGDKLRGLLVDYGPCLILIDEWVAYARQLHDGSDLPAGSFDTQFTFAQTLTESAKAAGNCLLVISLPASDTTGSPHTMADDAEVGGQRGREALERLRNVVGRLESSWRPASAEEGFEIVRRRLFEPLDGPAKFKDRDVVARAFADFYRVQRQEFPPECSEAEYEARIKAAYPIHPEIFDRLYTDWSTLAKFQRTRGVLRLMAAVIHSLWEKGDRNPLILPANISIDEQRVQFELTRYLPDPWVPVIEKDVDGPNSLPLRIDGEYTNLGKHSACRRVARAIYLGSAPSAAAAHRGIEDRRVKLGSVLPGESPAVFGDALRRLAAAATYLYHDGTRYWYSTQPTVTKLAEDRAEQLKREPDKVATELNNRVRADLQKQGDFPRVHALPITGADVMESQEASLVVLGSAHPYSKEAGNTAEKAAKAILESRGNAPRIYRNTLVFLAPDQSRLQELDEAIRRYLAWTSILAEKGEKDLNLDPHQVSQAENQMKSADATVAARIPEAYQWLLVPVQKDPQSPVEWQAIRLTGTDPLAVRASKKLRSDELLVSSLAGTRLRMELDRVPLWRGDNVSINQLAEDFAMYIYLPRLTSPAVLAKAAQDGVGLLLWEQDSFAYADSYDETKQRYVGLRAGQQVTIIDPASAGLLVKPEVARQQMDAEKPVDPPDVGPAPQPGGTGGTTGHGTGGGTTPPVVKRKQPKRFHGTVELDSIRVNRDVDTIATEVVQHLTAISGARVKITLDISAVVEDGVKDDVVRTVTENCNSLKFTQHGFEEE